MDIFKDENGEWDPDLLYFAKESGINANCQEDALMFICTLSGFDGWESVFNYLVDPEPFSKKDIAAINAAHDKCISFAKFNEWVTGCLEKSALFNDVVEPYVRKLVIETNISKESGGKFKETIFDDEKRTDDDEMDEEEALGIEMTRLHMNETSKLFKFIRLFEDEEAKIMADSKALSIIYLSRYHRNTKRATGEIPPAEKKEKGATECSNWLGESVTDMQLLSTTEATLNEFFKEHSTIDPISFCFLARCFYQVIKS